MAVGDGFVKVLTSLPEALYDAFFPRRCFGCRLEGCWLCDNCCGALIRKSLVHCPWCGVITEEGGGVVCGDCAQTWSVDRLLVVYEYHQPALERMVHSMKYRGAFDIGRAMGHIIARELGCNFLERRSDVVVIPLPLHRKRERERGFNQAAIIASVIARYWGIDCSRRSLVRVRHTKHQALLVPEERAENIAGAFSLKYENEIVGKDVVLVDDVCTTGSTLQEAGRVLKKGGARSVTAVAFARGHFDYGARLTGGR